MLTYLVNCHLESESLLILLNLSLRSGLSTEFTEEGFIPSLKPTPSLAEQEAAVRLSKAAVGPFASDHHVTLFDLLEVLQVNIRH